MKRIFYAVFLMTAPYLYAQNTTDSISNWNGNRPDGHAPISVMGDHTHSKGDFMFSYRFMAMAMENIRRGKDDQEPNSLLMPNGGDYMLAPIKMPMQMHMLGAMYAPSNRLTLMLMANYVAMKMDHLTAMGGTFTTESSGFGDIKLAALYKLYHKNRQQWHGQLGVSVPTGSIDHKDVTPASNGSEMILPYPMQIGSGTFDTEIGLTYLLQFDNNFSFGSQLKAKIRLGENDNGYTLGNHYDLNNWVAYKATEWLSFSARVQGLVVDEIEGLNKDLNPNIVLTADTKNSGGTYVNSGIGFNVFVPKGAFKNLRLGFEFALPVIQDVNGVQLKQKETVTTGIQYAF